MDSSIINDSEIVSELQALVIHNQDLEKLEGLLDQFNIFEVLHTYRQEMRHSDFLAYLLNPNQNHGLGDAFVKRFLQEAIMHADGDQPITPIQLDIWDLDAIEVRREWQDIDILLVDVVNKIVIIIENKVFSGEHGGQLKRYQRVVKQHFSGYTVIGLFLTPDGEVPSDPSFIMISYNQICQLLEYIIQSRETTLGHDVLVLMKHYVEILRRYIVGDSEIERLCQQIYKKHQRALDKIYEFLPDQQAVIQEYLGGLINATPQLELDYLTKSYIYFIPKNWNFPVLQKGQGWTPSGRMLLFVFLNGTDFLKLHLIIGPGPDEIRQKIHKIISENEPPFNRAFKVLGKSTSTVYKFNLLSKSSYQEKSMVEIQEEIKDKWNDFLTHELPIMDEVILRELKGFGNSEIEKNQITQ